MKRFSLVIIIGLISFNTQAVECSSIAKYDKLKSIIYVVCPNLASIPEERLNNIVESVFSSRKFVPDEYFILFIKSLEESKSININSKSLLGIYYTHNNRLTIWPNVPDDKRFVIIGGR